MCFWNINGRIRLLRSEIVYKWLHSNFDVIFITETHLTKGQIFELDAFNSYHNSYSTIDDTHPRGGISCFAKPSLLKYITDITTETPGLIVIKFKNGDIVFGSYIAPYDSAYYNITDFSPVANMFFPSNKDRVVLGGGDINSRVGDITYSLPLNGMKYLPNVDKTVNTHGNELLKICKSFKCYVVNNLKYNSKTFNGNFTFRKGERKSQNDIMLANLTGLKVLEKFDIHDVIWNPSDHTPVSVSFRMDLLKDDFSVESSSDLLSEAGGQKILKPRKIQSSKVNWDNYKSLVESDMPSYHDRVNVLRDANTLEKLDPVITSLSNSLYKAAKVNTERTRVDDIDESDEGIEEIIGDINQKSEQ